MRHLPALRSFVEVYSRGSVTEAARHLGLTQPGVSGHLRSIETLIGRPLFVRRGRGLAPTAAADDLARAVADHFATIESAVATLRARSTLVEGTVHVAGPADYLSERMAPAFMKLAENGVKVRLQFGNRERLNALLKSGDVDLAVTASRPSAAGTDHVRIDAERLLLVADPLTARRLLGTKLSAASLRLERWVAYDEELPLVREYFRHTFDEVPRLQSVVCAPDLRAVRRLTERGPALTVLPDYLCAASLEQGLLASIDDPRRAPSNDLYLVWNRASLRHPRVAFARDVLAGSGIRPQPPTAARPLGFGRTPTRRRARRRGKGEN